MNRQLKFRVWDKKRKVWVNHKYVCFDKDFNLIVPLGYHDPKDCIIQQFTGLLDFKGKEIYEGDFIKFEGDFERATYIVKFERGMFTNGYGVSIHKIIYEGDNVVMNACKIIGNIFENPKLIKS